ncbi:MAG: ATP-dependent Clp protease proteolytic subunit [Phycisphaerae bacterium]|nr:ATP-dependent Clp protease proteolytic subunit [Phycisphaerae bacterium]
MNHRPGLPALNMAVPQKYGQYREMTIEDLLLENRIVFLAGEIDERSASIVIMRMLYLQNLNRDQDINLYVNSPGGLVDQTLAIYDTMQYLTCDIATYCIGRAESGGAVILTAGTKGKRYALPNARMMMHQPWGGVGGQASDIQIQAEEIIKNKRILNDILATHTGQPLEKIASLTERDYYMSAAEAKEFGLIDDLLVDERAKKKTESK